MRVLQLILPSLLLHFLAAALLLQVPEEWIWLAPDPSIAEIEIVERPSEEPDRRSIVRQTEPPPRLRDEESQEDARFMSERDQRVVQETRARRTGLTRNGQALPQNSWMKTMDTSSGESKTSEPRSLDGYEPIKMPKPQEASQIAFEDAPSSVGETMPDDIAIGDFTALNTDRFKYYSFYARIEELVRYRWERRLQAAINSLDHSYLLRVVGRQNWVTSVEFVLTPQGRFVSARIYKESGLRPFDLAAVNAFREAGYFPNPPAEMVKNGSIKIQYSFNVRWNPSAFAESD